MADVFISYAREDQPFVRKLQDALEAHNRNTWLDWKSIPPTAEWKQEVYSAIDNADSFAAVISPDFIVSKPCQDELDHAAHDNKRMVPLWHRDVDDEEVPPDLAARQYVYLREDDDFEDALERLLEALDTDMEWVHDHTRLLVRAKEWESKGHDSSMLLRGRELREAEEWQARAAHKEPKPTSLQSEYILASRRASSRRYRATIGVMGLAAVFFVVLAATSLWLWREARSNAQEAQANAQEARANEQEARTQASIALSRLLLAQSSELQESQPDVSLLLNVEALRRAPAAAKEEREEVRFALLDKLDRPYHPSTPLTGHTEALNGVVFSPDGELLASASADGTVRLWDVATGKPRGQPITGHTETVNDVEFSPDGNVLASAGYDETVRLWEVATGKPRGEPLKGHTDGVWGVGFSPDGNLLASASADKTVRLWTVTSRQPLDQLNGHTKPVIGVAFSPDGKLLASASADRTVRLWDVATGKPHGEPLKSHTNWVLDVAFSPDGELLASASTDSTVRLWDVATGKPRFVIGGDAEEQLPDQFESALHYVTVDFEPAFSFEVGQDWEFVAPETTHRVDVGTGPKGGELIFTNPSHVYDPSNPSEPKELPAPQNAKEWLSWFQRHPNLETSKPDQVSVGGASGMQIDVTASSTPENNPRDICGKKPCIPLFRTGWGKIIAQPSGTGKDRYVIVDVGGQTVIINVTAPPGKFDAFAPKAQEVLDSVEWKGG